MSIDDNFLKDTVKFNSQHEKRPDPITLPDGSEKTHIGSGYVTSLLGEGGMSRVYEIWNNRLEVFRAVKLLQPNSSEETKQRFQTEMKITAKLHHPNIIEIHEVGEWNRIPFIEMERIKGYSLDRIVEDRGALNIAACTAIGILVGKALKYAHGQKYSIYGTTYRGIIHRDLKPANIMVTTEGSLKLMDFGIARPADASLHTTDGSILGTLQYLSPEQIEGKRIDARSDIYSLGCTLYEIITGLQAFPEKNISKLMNHKINGEYKHLSSFDYKIPKRLKKLINRCLAHNPDARIQNAEKFLNEIKLIHRQITTASPQAVLKKMINNSGVSRKKVLSEKKNLLVFPVFIIIFLLLISVSAVWGYYWYINYRGNKKTADSEGVYQIPEEKEEEKLPSKDTKDRESQPGREKKDIEQPLVDKRVKTVYAPKKMESKKTYAQQMLDKYSADNTESLHLKLVRMKKYSDAAEVYQHLPLKIRKKREHQLFHMRALWNLGSFKELQKFISENKVDDAEYNLFKARCLYRQNDTQRALENLDKSMRKESRFMDAQKLKLDILYFKALCLTDIFENNINRENYKKSLDGWWELKNQLRESPDSAYSRKAREETQRIARLFKNNQR